MDMLIEPPKTIEDFEAIRETILELMGNPYCDKPMRLKLSKKLDKVDAKISELKVQ